MTNLNGEEMGGYMELSSHLAELDGIAASLFSTARLLDGLAADIIDEYDTVNSNCMAAASSMMYVYSDNIRHASSAILSIYEAHSREFLS